MPAPQTEVVVSVAGAEIARFVLAPGEYVVGRNADCAIRVEAELVSRRHARLTLDGDSAQIEDLGSANGTFVNDAPITGRTRLFPSQKIRLGAATISLRRVPGEAASDGSLAPAQAALRRMLPAEMLREKKYDIGAVVARGGMGAILEAREAAIERQVAMKVMLATNDAGDIARFVAEAKVTGQLEHPNIPPVHELAVDENGQPFYTMKMVQGITLKKVLDLMAAGTAATLAKYPLAALLTIFQKVCDALAFAHSRGVIHRDLKPENIMLGDFGEVLVMDWGLAKRLNDEGRMTHDEAEPVRSSFDLRHSSFSGTLAGTVMGTPQFMSPEQARGEIDKVDARSDIYSLGAILYQILALRVSVTGADAWEIVGKVGRGELEPLVERAAPRAFRRASLPKAGPNCRETPGSARGATRSTAHGATRSTAGEAVRPIPDSLAAVVRKAMSLPRTPRYQSVAELQADLAAYQGGFATSAENAGKWKRFTLFVRRNKAASIGTAAVIVLSIGFMAKVIAEGKRAESALRELRGTAPTFHAQAAGLLNDGKFDDALMKIGFAIKLDDGHADYRLFRANLLQASQRLREAAAEYREVLRLRPEDRTAEENLAISEKLLRENGTDVPLERPVQLKLLAALRQQKRLVESAPLNALLDPDIAIAEAALRARLRSYAQQPGWSNGRVKRMDDGTFSVELGGLALGDLSLLQGQPISALNLIDTKLTDLRPLAGLQLKSLKLSRTAVNDFTPLKGMPLEELWISECKNVTTLISLSGLHLVRLRMGGTPVSDLGGLRNMPLKELEALGPEIRSLEPLRGLPLVSLKVDGNFSLADLTPLSDCRMLESLSIYQTAIRDIRPLAHLPLKYLKINATKVTDLGPLLDCPTLTDLIVPESTKNIELLRQLPNLKRLSKRVSDHRGIPAQSTEEFWAEYDAQQAAAKK